MLVTSAEDLALEKIPRRCTVTYVMSAEKLCIYYIYKRKTSNESRTKKNETYIFVV